MKKKFKQFAIVCLVIGNLALILTLTGCVSAQFTAYRRSFQSELPKEKMSGECVFRGTTNLSGKIFLRYDLYDIANWDKHISSIAYLVPQSVGAPLIVEKMKQPIRHEELNASFIFYSNRIQKKYLQNVIDRMKMSKHPVHTSILLVCATQDGKGTQVSILSKKNSKWVKAGPYITEQPIQKKTWWVNILPTGYLITVPIDVVTFPIQASVMIFEYIIYIM